MSKFFGFICLCMLIISSFLYNEKASYSKTIRGKLDSIQYIVADDNKYAVLTYTYKDNHYTIKTSDILLFNIKSGDTFTVVINPNHNYNNFIDIAPQSDIDSVNNLKHKISILLTIAVFSLFGAVVSIFKE